MDSAPSNTGLLTQKQYARRRGWSKQYVNQLVKQGRLPITNGLIDPALADKALAQTQDPARTSAGLRAPSMARAGASGIAEAGEGRSVSGEFGATPVQGSYAKARTVREHFRAMREKLEFEAIEGKLVSKKDVDAAMFSAGRVIRDSLIQSADTMADRIAVEYSLAPEALRPLLREEMRRLLNQLSGALNEALNDALAE